jgi:hypothetical protein
LIIELISFIENSKSDPLLLSASNKRNETSENIRLKAKKKDKNTNKQNVKPNTVPRGLPITPN